MDVENQIREKLQVELQLEHLEIENESYKHNVPTGSETHFHLVLVSNDFKGKMPVKRHQMVYRILAEELQGPVKALALHTYIPDEWAEVNRQAPGSPDCLGVGK